MFTFDNGGNRAAAAAVRLPAHPRPPPLKGFVSIELKQVCHSQAGGAEAAFLSLRCNVVQTCTHLRTSTSCKAVIGPLFCPDPEHYVELRRKTGEMTSQKLRMNGILAVYLTGNPLPKA